MAVILWEVFGGHIKHIIGIPICPTKIWPQSSWSSFRTSSFEMMNRNFAWKMESKDPVFRGPSNWLRVKISREPPAITGPWNKPTQKNDPLAFFWGGASPILSHNQISFPFSRNHLHFAGCSVVTSGGVRIPTPQMCFSQKPNGSSYYTSSHNLQ